MAKMTKAIVIENGVTQTVKIDDALNWRNRGYFCRECKQPVIPHKASAYGAAHFEHRNRNSACTLSDRR